MKGIPNTFIVGAAKCATTSMCKYLDQHPDIYLPKVKEPHYFSLGLGNHFKGPGDEQVSKEVPNSMQDYLAPFQNRNEKILIDGSTTYFPCEDSPKAIKEFCPDAKIIIAFRNPARRAFSAYTHLRREQREHEEDFEKALKLEQERTANNYTWMWRYKDISNYCDKVQRYYDTFDSKNIHVILFEDFRKEPGLELSKTCKFLGVDDNFEFDTEQQYNKSAVFKKSSLMKAVWSENVALKLAKKITPRSFKNTILKTQTYRLKLDPEVQKRLSEEFAPVIDKLEIITGRNLDSLRG
jgi:hypothetical protein